MRVAVLASGSGTLLEAILAADVPVDLVLVDRPCRATEIATAQGVDAVVVERTNFGESFDREGYSEQVVKQLAAADIDLVVMAGFGTILGGSVFDAYPARILNTHPALLPSFKGWHAVPDALEYGVKVTGCTVHLAVPEVDAGPILAQRAVEVADDDTVETLHERIKQVERVLYPDTVKAVLADPTVLDRAAARPSPQES